MGWVASKCVLSRNARHHLCIFARPMSYQCSICDKSYTTSSHLARHTVAHKPDRHFKCSFCSKTYVRQDVARRHSEKCTKRLGQPIPKSQGRGQPRKACKRCSDAKIACDGTTPCGSCVRSAALCSYSRLAVGSETPIPNMTRSNTHRPPTLSNGVTATRAASRFPFLLSYTAAETGNPSDFAKALETLRSNSESAASQNEPRVGDEPIHSFQMFTQLFAAEFFQLDIPQGSSSLLEFLPQPTPDSDAHEDVLRSRASELVELLKQGAESSLFHDVIANLLTPTNLGLCIENFFQYAYRHVPIVHKPSFVVASTESSLLLSVFVVGAIWSYPRDTYFMVLDVIELVEQCIFESLLFADLHDPGRSNLNTRSPGVLPLLQAATMIVAISFALPNARHRQRFRNQRFTDLVLATRLLRAGSEKASHTWTDVNFEWTEYIISESCSRVMYYVYLLDCHISTIYAVLPRISVLEMQVSLPSNESIFSAENGELFRERLSSDLAAPQYSLVNLVQELMAVESTGLELCRLTAFPLFLTIGALQTMIFTAKTQLLDTFQSVCFERALTHWKALWDNCQDMQKLTKEVGFMVHAEEVWLLAQKVLKSDASRLISRFGVNDMAQIRQWLTELD